MVDCGRGQGAAGRSCCTLPCVASTKERAASTPAVSNPTSTSQRLKVLPLFPIPFVPPLCPLFPLQNSQAPFYVLVETSGSSAEHDGAKLEAFLERALEAGLVGDGAIAQDGAQAAAFWHIREGITEALRHRGEERPLGIKLGLWAAHSSRSLPPHALPHLCGWHPSHPNSPTPRC